MPLFVEDPKAPPLELLCQVREEGTELATRTF